MEVRSDRTPPAGTGHFQRPAHSPFSTRMQSGWPLTVGSFPTSSSAARTAASFASCVISTIGTARPFSRSFWMTLAMLISWRARIPATAASTPGLSSAWIRM